MFKNLDDIGKHYYANGFDEPETEKEPEPEQKEQEEITGKKRNKKYFGTQIPKFFVENETINFHNKKEKDGRLILTPFSPWRVF